MKERGHPATSIAQRYHTGRFKCWKKEKETHQANVVERRPRSFRTPRPGRSQKKDSKTSFHRMREEEWRGETGGVRDREGRLLNAVGRCWRLHNASKMQERFAVRWTILFHRGGVLQGFSTHPSEKERGFEVGRERTDPCEKSTEVIKPRFSIEGGRGGGNLANHA